MLAGFVGLGLLVLGGRQLGRELRARDLLDPA